MTANAHSPAQESTRDAIARCRAEQRAAREIIHTNEGRLWAEDWLKEEVILLFASGEDSQSGYDALEVPNEWLHIKDGDPIAREMFRRHYTYQRRRDQFRLFGKIPNDSLFVGPGEKTVLLTRDHSALFVWWKFIDACIPAQTGVNCAVFRNEGSWRSSELIRSAAAIAWKRWPNQRLYTYVNSSRIKSKNPGYCFIAAGWSPCGHTKGGLRILELLP